MFLLNGNPVNVTKFPDNTSQVWNIDLPTCTLVEIEWKFEGEWEVMHLVQLVELLQEKCFYYPDIHLHMDYLPYARQDKPISNDSCFALSCFANIINMMDLNSVTALDPHSEIPKNLIISFSGKLPEKQIKAAITTVNPRQICFPDRGAHSRYGGMFSSWSENNILIADKTRNPMSGAIEKITVDRNSGESILIVDDICDGGATFIALANALNAKEKSVWLYTTHGLYSKGLSDMRKSGIKRFFSKKGEAFEDSYGNIYFNKEKL